MGFTKHKHDSLNNNTNSTLSCKSCSRLIRRVRCSRQLSIFTSLLFVLIFIIYNMSHSSPMLQTLTKSTLNRTYENNLPETDTISIFTESLKETIEAALTPLTKVDHLDVSTGLGLFPMSLRNFSNVVDSYRAGLLNSNVIQPINLRYSNMNFSISPSTNSGVDLLIIVKSARKNFKRRSVVRQTWGNLTFLQDNLRRPHNIAVQIFFIVGKSNSAEEGKDDDDSNLKEEIELYKDMIVADFVDSYRNLTYKSVGAFKWVLNEFKGEFKYLALLDDDIYIDMGGVGSFLKDIKKQRVMKIKSRHRGFPFYRIVPEQNTSIAEVSIADISNGLYIGNINYDMNPIRQLGSKWFVSLADYNYDAYPPYQSGSGIIFDYKAASDFYYASAFVRHFSVDDAYLGIVAGKLGVLPIQWMQSQIKLTFGFRCPEQNLDYFIKKSMRDLRKCPAL